MNTQRQDIPLTEKEQRDAQWADAFHREQMAKKNLDDYARRQQERERAA